MKLFFIIFAAIIAAAGVIFGAVSVSNHAAETKVTEKAQVERNAAYSITLIKAETTFEFWRDSADDKTKKAMLPDIHLLASQIRVAVQTKPITGETKGKALKLADDIDRASR